MWLWIISTHVDKLLWTAEPSGTGRLKIDEGVVDDLRRKTYSSQDGTTHYGPAEINKDTDDADIQVGYRKNVRRIYDSEDDEAEYFNASDKAVKDDPSVR